MATPTVWAKVWFSTCFNVPTSPQSSVRTLSERPPTRKLEAIIPALVARLLLSARCGKHARSSWRSRFLTASLKRQWRREWPRCTEVQKTCDSHSCWRPSCQSGVTAGHKFMKWGKVAVEMNYHEKYCFSSFCVSCTTNSAEVCEVA